MASRSHPPLEDVVVWTKAPEPEWTTAVVWASVLPQ